ncbi:hypothetical protein CLV59_103489 [Chitinophaga dinghuensis]|uniref:Uncharacterized protein n=1 Tax=Chitinophaga dinghuensis TaxID=1539050 RepID=A0A327W2L4_9BACT|nr:type VI secretion system baseplate subunit TssF [Chitinophaga dinghuensis]RAJ83521.1 hypothetical protein CLV59_103489 [Chitinophaga dinghuensis]
MKTTIKERLLRLACRAWNLSEQDMDTLLDPVVKLLLEGLAKELEKLQSEHYTHQALMIERLASILIPSIHACSQPADLLLHALPKEEIIITPQQEFITQLPQIAEKIAFIPAGNYKLTPGHITHVVSPDTVLQINELMQISVLVNDTIWYNTPSQIYARLEYPSGAIADLHHVSLFFQVRNTNLETLLQQVLPIAKLYVNDQPIRIISGFPNELNASHSATNWTFWQQKYRQQFLTILDHYDIQEIKKHIPEPLRQYQQQNELKTLEEGIWLRIELPGFPTEVLPDIICQVNCFPAVNLLEMSLSLTATHEFQVHVLSGKQYFYHLHSCTDQLQRSYQQEKIKTISDLLPGEFTCDYPVRKRWEEHDLQQQLQFIIHRLQEEYRLLQPTQNGILLQQLQDLQQLISDMHQHIHQEEKFKWPILSIKPLPDANFIFLKYFCTAGELANNIPLSTAFQTTEDESYIKGSIKSMTVSAGGKQPLTTTGITHHFRQQFFSGNKIVTPADIRLCCFAIMGEHLLDCHIENGYRLSASIQEGYRRVLQISLVLNSGGLPYAPSLLTHYKECILQQLQEKSFQLLPVCISFIQDA